MRVACYSDEGSSLVRVRRPARALATLAVLAALVAGCTASGSGDADRTAATGGTLRVANANEYGDQDPHDYNGDWFIAPMVFETLVKYGQGGRLEPGLATSWQVAADGLTIDFELRTGVKFHDDTPFDEQAAKWNLDRWVGKESHSWLAASKIIKAVEVPGPMKLRLRLGRAYDPLLQELTFTRPPGFMSPKAVDASGKFTKAIGTGPWRLEQITTTAASLVRNDGYWGAKPKIDRVEFSVRKDSQTRVSALRAGEVDMLGGSYLAPISPTEAVTLGKDERVTVLHGDPDITVMLGFNLNGIAGDKAIREAVRYALDRETLTKVLYAGQAKAATTLFAPGIPDAGAPQSLPFDPDQARRILDAAGWRQEGKGRVKDGKQLVLSLRIPSTAAVGWQDSRLSAQAVASALGEVGITVNIVAVDEATFYDDLHAGKYDLAFMETYGAPYDPSGFVVGFLTGDRKDPGLWKTDEVERLIDGALYARDAATRAKNYQDAWAVLNREAAFVPIAYRPRVWAVGPAVKGFQVPHTEYDFDLSTVTLQR